MLSEVIVSYLNTKKEEKKMGRVNFASEADKRILSEIVAEFAEQYDLCADGVAEFCEEVGIPVPTKNWEIAISVTITVVASDEQSADQIVNEVMSEIENTQYNVDGVEEIYTDSSSGYLREV